MLEKSPDGHRFSPEGPGAPGGVLVPMSQGRMFGGGRLWSPLQILRYGTPPFRPHVSLNLLPKTFFPDARENPKEEPKPSCCCSDWTIGRESSGSHQRAFQRTGQTAKGEVKGEAGSLCGCSVVGSFIYSSIHPPPLHPATRGCPPDKGEVRGV